MVREEEEEEEENIYFMSIDLSIEIKLKRMKRNLSLIRRIKTTERERNIFQKNIKTTFLFESIYYNQINQNSI